MKIVSLDSASVTVQPFGTVNFKKGNNEPRSLFVDALFNFEGSNYEAYRGEPTYELKHTFSDGDTTTVKFTGVNAVPNMIEYMEETGLYVYDK